MYVCEHVGESTVHMTMYLKEYAFVCVSAGGEKHDRAEPYSISSGSTPCPPTTPKDGQPITVIN